MRKSILLLVLASVMMLAVVTEASAQSCSSNPSACAPATSVTYGTAKAHQHNDFAVEYGAYCGRWLVTDSANNPGNNFYGNTICYEHWLWGPTWLYYDWSADPNAGVKISMWESSHPAIWVTYDQSCSMVTVASTSSPW